MNFKNLFYILAGVSVLSCTSNNKSNNSDEMGEFISVAWDLEVDSYPETKKDSTVDDYFGNQIEDPYRWLEIDTATEVEAWVKRQNSFTESILSQFPIRKEIEKRLSQLYNYKKQSAPFRKGRNMYYYENSGLQNQSILYMKKDGEEAKVFMDPNQLSEDGTIALSSLSFSDDNKYLAYSTAEIGSDWKTLKIKNLEDGTELDEVLNNLKFGGAAWQGNGFYYSAYPKPKKGTEYSAATVSPSIYYHKLGEAQKDDQLIYKSDAEKQRYFWPATYKNQDDVVFVSISEGTHGNELYFKKTDNLDGPLTPVFTGFDFDYSIVDAFDDHVLILTNRNAPNYKLISVKLGSEANSEGEVVIAEGSQVLSNISKLDRRLYAHYLQDASSQIIEFDLKGDKKAEIELPGIGSVSGFGAEDGSKELFYTYSSYTKPATAYKFDVETRKSELYFKSDFAMDLDQFESKRVWYKSKDGTPIPMIVTHKKGLSLNGDNPTLLYGYGGFNISIRPGFKADRMMFLENGGVLAVANLRGGGEYGEDWHHAGILEKKQNVFDDFIAAAEYLIEAKYTNSNKLAIEGRSNGGLLVGACMVQRPDLYRVALPTVGVLDMLRYHKFTVGWGWAVEYGSSDYEDQFNYLIKYSPLHNVKDAEYPATLVLTGDHDDRVVPAHSFKFAASLQEHQKGSYPVLIRIEENAGHGAGKPISKVIEENTDIWTFVMQNLEMNMKISK